MGDILHILWVISMVVWAVMALATIVTHENFFRNGMWIALAFMWAFLIAGWFA